MTPPTPRLYADLHDVHAFCRHCDREVWLDLPALIQGKHGDTPLVRLPLVCTGCGQRGHQIVISAKSHPFKAG